MEGSEELCEYLSQSLPDLDHAVLDNFKRHKIDGFTFLQLNEEYLREVAPLLGDRIKIKKIISEALNEFLESPELERSTLCFNADRRSTTSSTPSLTTKVTPKSLTYLPPVAKKRKDGFSPSPPPLSPPPFSPPFSERSHMHSHSDGASSSSCVDADWIKRFIVPTRFSKSTMKCIEAGILSSHARDEIINSLATCIMLYTTSPTAVERRRVCQRLVETHHTLKDSVGSGYDSWARKLTDKFKNLHRSDRAEKAGIKLQPIKRAKVDEVDEMFPTSTDLEVYDRHNTKMHTDYLSGKWSVSSISSLMEETFYERKKYLKGNPVAQAMDQFPWLKEPALIMKEFSLYTGKDPAAFQSSWLEIEEKVLKYAEIEDKKKIKSLIKEYKSSEYQNTPDRKTTYALLILSALFLQRGQTSDSFFIPFEGEVLDIEECISSLPYKHPYVAAFGKDKNCLTDTMLVIERATTIHTPNLATAVHCAFCSYYIFDIVYPRNNKNMMLFLEHLVYKVKSSAPLSTTVTIVIDALMKL